MVRICEDKDLEQMIELAYGKNNDESHYSAYCCCKREQISEEFTVNINTEDSRYVGCFENERLIGLLCGYIDRERNHMDCAGPFVEGDFIKISSEMFELMKTLENSEMTYNFYFGKKNVECISFMLEAGAENQGDEYQLSINRDNYIRLETTIPVKPLAKEYEDSFICLHDTIFPEIYISGNGIIKSLGDDRQVFCAFNGKELVGYSVLKTYKDSKAATAEIIGVAESYRHKGYGRSVLNKLLETAFDDKEIETVNLIVDQVNEKALSLYYSRGFELLKVNCNYNIVEKDLQHSLLSNEKLLNNSSELIVDFEDIQYYDTPSLRNKLQQLELKCIILASMGASPQVNEILQELLPEVDFPIEQKNMGRVKIEEIEKAQIHILMSLNK